MAFDRVTARACAVEWVGVCVVGVIDEFVRTYISISTGAESPVSLSQLSACGTLMYVKVLH